MKLRSLKFKSVKSTNDIALMLIKKDNIKPSIILSERQTKGRGTMGKKWISKKHPILAISFLVILFSLAGIPPLGGFFAKFYVFTAVVEQQMYALAIIGLLTTVISAFYYLKIIKTIYFDDSVISFDNTKNKFAQLSIFISCSILLTFFLYPSVLSNVVDTLFLN